MGRRAPTRVRIGLWITAVACAATALLGSGTGRPAMASAQGSSTVASAPATTAVSTPPTTPVSTPPTTPVSTPPTTHPTVSTTAAKVTVTTRAPVTIPPVSYTYQSTTSSSTTSTTIASIFGHLPVSPSTVPLDTKGSNGHFATKLGWLSAGGFGLAFLIILARFVSSRPRRDEPVSS